MDGGRSADVTTSALGITRMDHLLMWKALWPLLAGVKPEDPQIREALPPRELPVLDEGDADDFWKPLGEFARAAFEYDA